MAEFRIRSKGMLCITGAKLLDNIKAALIASGQFYTTTQLVDPTRTELTYMTSLGGTATLAGFLAAVEQQSKSNWNTAYTAAAINAYIQAGFMPIVGIAQPSTKQTEGTK